VHIEFYVKKLWDMPSIVSVSYRHLVFNSLYTLCTKFLSVERWITLKLASCSSTKKYYIITKIIPPNMTVIFVSGIMDVTSPTLQDTLLTQHVISSGDRMELGVKSVRHFKKGQYITYTNAVILNTNSSDSLFCLLCSKYNNNYYYLNIKYKIFLFLYFF
jgi:hypothetical protein